MNKITNRNFYKLSIFVYLLCLFGIVLSFERAYPLTLDEAINLAKENLPYYKASLLKVKSTEELYKASMSPYLPTLDLSTSKEYTFTSYDNLENQIYDFTLSYTLFDGGKRSADRKISLYNININTEELRKTLLDLEYEVKSAFYNVIAKKESLEQRKIQLKDAEKDFEVADGRYKLGVAKLSDTLQASVRLEQAKFNVVEAEGEYRKALSELNSIIGKSLESEHEIIEQPVAEFKEIDFTKLYETTLNRPEIKQAEYSVMVSEENKRIETSPFYPKITLLTSYTKIAGDKKSYLFGEEKNAVIKATWNLFELGKFFKRRASEYDIKLANENLNEFKRRYVLETFKTYEDYITAYKNLIVAKEQLKSAEFNYSQALGEYKVGKADILSLVQSEIFLSNAREQLVNSKLKFMLSKAMLERVLGIEKIETLNPK
jgi:outer membrane protein TolC